MLIVIIYLLLLALVILTVLTFGALVYAFIQELIERWPRRGREWDEDSL